MTFQIENCKYNNLDLAIQFFNLGMKFKSIYYKQRTLVDFSKCSVHKNTCGTVACHGGFGLCALGKPEDTHKYNFLDGAILISRYLGFNNVEHLEYWATQNPKYWNNEYGFYMFKEKGYLSFGFTIFNKYQLTLLDIASHYFQVSLNLLNPEKH